MTETDQMYKCEICGNLVSVLESGKGELVCCGKPMNLLEEKTSEQEGNEKHVPVVEMLENIIKITVSSVSHPMEENHCIELIQLIKDGKIVADKRLSPGDEPVAEFCNLDSIEGLKARALCNIHGLWKN